MPGVLGLQHIGCGDNSVTLPINEITHQFHSTKGKTDSKAGAEVRSAAPTRSKCSFLVSFKQRSKFRIKGDVDYCHSTLC